MNVAKQLTYPSPETGTREEIFPGCAIITFKSRKDVACIEFQNSLTSVPLRSRKSASGFLRKGDYTYLYIRQVR
jgi:hypothetical protein